MGLAARWEVDTFQRKDGLMTLGKALDDYFTDVRVRSKSKETVRQTKHHISRIIEYLALPDALRLTPADFSRLIDSLRGEGLADTTINGTLRILRAALQKLLLGWGRLFGGKHDYACRLIRPLLRRRDALLPETNAWDRQHQYKRKEHAKRSCKGHSFFLPFTHCQVSLLRERVTLGLRRK